MNKKETAQMDRLNTNFERLLATLTGGAPAPASEKPDDPITQPKAATSVGGIKVISKAGPESKASKPKASTKTVSPMVAGIRRIPGPRASAKYSRMIMCGADEKRIQGQSLHPDDTWAREKAKEFGALNKKHGKEVLHLIHSQHCWSGADKYWAETSLGDVPREDITWAEFEKEDPIV